MANNVNVTNRGFEYICQWAANTANTTTPYANYTIPTCIGWGTANGSNATSVLLPATTTGAQGTGQWMDVAPYFEAPESRVAGTVSVINNTAASGTVTTQVTATITCTQPGGETIGETFLAFTTTKPTASSIATGNMTNVQTLMTVATITAFPSPPFYVQVDNEVILVNTTAASNVFNSITRARNASTAAIHNQNAGVTLGNIPGAGTANPNSGDLFAHAGFVGLALNLNDSIAFTWQVNVTS